jgi:RNA polymerase sigma-70 factor (ECF subfamily)
MRTTARATTSRAARTAASPAPAAPAETPRSGEGLSRASVLAAEVKALVLAGERDVARDRFGDLVANQQRRALRIAYHYLRDACDADEAVQDAFVKVFTHITTYREHLPFEVWFTRILVNGCLDLRKARGRRLRWALPMSLSPELPALEPPSPQISAEDRLVSSERAREIVSAVDRLPERQRTVFTLCHIAEQTTAEISHALGVSEATVRVHLFRAVRKLRRLLGAAETVSRGGAVR